MFQLEHVNLVVKDISATLDLILTAFPDWQVRGQGEGDWYGPARISPGQPTVGTG
ncbi:hypothetical protein ACQ0MK_15710 [Thalassospira lucentensis]|uniref:hypothetical protein n=1 Tax=Thalassospira lucentensis TaxID=168935 RepID=UPI003D2EF315